MNIGEGYLFSVDESRHDYGGVLGGEDGHEFPFVQAGPEDEKGVSVSLVERAAALARAADMYGRYKRAAGLQKAVETPAHRAELKRRYYDVDDVAQRAAANSHYTQETEHALLQPLLKEQMLIDAGFDPSEVDHMAISTIYDIRQSFGVEVGSEQRQKNLRRIRRE